MMKVICKLSAIPAMQRKPIRKKPNQYKAGGYQKPPTFLSRPGAQSKKWGRGIELGGCWFWGVGFWLLGVGFGVLALGRWFMGVDLWVLAFS